MVSLIMYVLFALVGAVILLTGNSLLGVLLLVVGAAGAIAMVIIRSMKKEGTSRFFAKKWNLGPVRAEHPNRNQPANIWDEVSQKRDEK